MFGLYTLLDSTANRMAPIVAVEARLRVRNPPRITAAAFPTVCSGFGIISFEFWSLEFSVRQYLEQVVGVESTPSRLKLFAVAPRPVIGPKSITTRPT